MNPFRQVKQSLGLKLFFSYLVIIVIGVTVLVFTAQGVAPAAFDRHMAGMMGDSMMGSSGMMGSPLGDFRRALAEAVLIAGGVSLVAAAIVSYFVSRRILAPVREIMTASREMVSGRYSRRVGIVGTDELSALAHNFNTMAASLEHTEERRQQLIADMAHELRTPLTTIKSYMEGLQDGVVPAEPGTYELVNREATRLARLVQDLEELSMAEAQQLNLRLISVRAGDLVEATVSRIRPQYQEKGVQMETSVIEPLPSIFVDEDRIIQVILNLLGNALQHTPTGGRVRVEVSCNREELHLAVTDTGEGIAAEHLPHVFDRFYRSDRSRSRLSGGSGLGLTIARHIVESHGGRIWAESNGVGKGSRFSFALPVPKG